MNRFEGKNAIVTGAASGIGQATVLRLLEEGAQVQACDLNEEGLQKTIDLAKDKGKNALPTVCDIGDRNSVNETVAKAMEFFGELHVLCNVAGILRSGHSHEFDLDLWEKVIHTNLTGTFMMCQASIPHLLKTKGAIVNTSSSAALGGHPWMAAYAASKGAIISMTRSLACEYAEQGLRTNAVVPGAIITPLHEDFKMPKGVNPNLITRIMPVVPYAQPDRVASAIAFLASDDASYMNGSDFRVDGGMLS